MLPSSLSWISGSCWQATRRKIDEIKAIVRNTLQINERCFFIVLTSYASNHKFLEDHMFQKIEFFSAVGLVLCGVDKALSESDGNCQHDVRG